MNKTVKGEKAVRKAKVSVPIRYAAQQYQFIDLTPSAVGRGFSPDQEDPPCRKSDVSRVTSQRKTKGGL